MAYCESSSKLKVAVVDNGKGIKADEMSQLFSKFGKLWRTAEMNSEGLGMGLMICKQLVELNQGTISVHSKGENLGSAFTFTMHMQQSKPKLIRPVKNESTGRKQKKSGTNLKPASTL